MNTEKEDLLLIRHLHDLEMQSYQRGIETYSPFLNLNEIHLFHSKEREFTSAAWGFFGGYPDAERVKIGFYQTDLSFPCHIPITTLCIAPRNKKFSDTLTHRDFLGAILNLGIERSTIGDILVFDNIGYLFCEEKISALLIDELIKIKHTFVTCNKSEINTFDIRPSLKDIRGTVASIRLDSILSTALNTSRSSVISYIEGGKVFVNGKQIISNGYSLKENDILSVRGKGRYKYIGSSGFTKKGKCSILIQEYC